ncbi:flagellar basal body rod protein FlgB [Cytobacillus sp. FJAT-54145]|uniref:Flagellar basal body rod protein FlgB n=1 Tax=Cytobacillus spartinae TaxID=3299023 RepID=A0ABW6K5R5_9BACI
MKLFSNTITTLEKALDYSSLKQKAISQNISNVDTPNYKAKDVNFKSVFQSTLDQTITANRTDARHYQFQGVPSTQKTIINRNDTSYNHNGNNVDLDKEMADLAKNQIYYNALIERVNGKFNSLQTVIRGGK